MSGAPSLPAGPLLEARRLCVWFAARRGQVVRAVDEVSLVVERGRTLALVGESGSGKTVLGRALLRLVPVKSGDVLFEGRSILPLRGAALRRLRRRMQLVFQDPFGSLNPRLTVADIVGESLLVHRLASSRAMARAAVAAILDRVGLPADAALRLPHEFSAGQRQRIGIARALVLAPDLVVCDEAVSSLDVSVRAQILNLLLDLQDELGLAYLFIAHDLAVVQSVADRVAVMYLGQIVEVAPNEALFARPAHPYTRALLASIPTVDPQAPAVPPPLGEPPPTLEPPAGCRFHPRCPEALDRCRSEAPPVYDLGQGHTVRCWLHAEAGPRNEA